MGIRYMADSTKLNVRPASYMKWAVFCINE